MFSPDKQMFSMGYMGNFTCDIIDSQQLLYGEQTYMVTIQHVYQDKYEPLYGIMKFSFFV